MRSFKQKNNKYVMKRYSWYLLVGQAFVRGELLEENDGNMSKLLYYAFNLTILNLMTEHKYTKVYTKACILNNSVYAVIKARTHIYIWSLRMKSHVSTFCEHDPCSEMIAKGSFALCHFSQIHCKE